MLGQVSASTTHSPRIPMRRWLGTIVMLPIVGLVIGAIGVGLGSAIYETIEQVTSRSFDDLLALLAAVTFTVINVIAVSAFAFTSGAMIGVYSGATLALGVLVIAILTTRWGKLPPAVTTVALGLLGSAGAAYGAIATATADATFTGLAPYILGGLIFGIFAANAALPKVRSRA